MENGATMIELLAAAPDGWAIAREGDRLWLVRPPYFQRDRDGLSAAQVERALMEEDFALEEPVRNFEGWGQLCRELEERRVQGATPEELESAREAALRLLARADAEQARRHLTQIRARLEGAQLQGVESALLALLGSRAVQQDPALVSEVHELLATERRARPTLRRRAQPQNAWPVADEAAVAQEAQAIRESHSILFSGRAA
jgi:hypothetical protein